MAALLLHHLALLLLGTVALLALQSAAQAAPEGGDADQVALRNADFATGLYRKLAGGTDGNVVVSPLALTQALAALAEGAAGQTQELLWGALKLSPLQMADAPDRLPQLLQAVNENVLQASLRYDEVAALFAAPSVEVEAAYKERAKQFFRTEVQSVDFANAMAATTAINDHVRAKTGEKIRDVVSTSLDAKTQLLLISAAFFKGQWTLPFNASFSQEERFYVDKYHIAQVQMMFRSDKFHLAYDAALKVGVLKLPCSGGAAMLVIFPDEDVDVTSVDDEIFTNTYRDWVKKLKRTRLEVQIPRFSLKQSYSLKNTLASLGMPDAFQGNADLSTLSKTAGLKLDEVQMTTAIEVDETGSLPDSASPPDPLSGSLPPRLTINRPFVFLVYHEASLNLLLMGRVVDPTKN
ncbi:serpin peptidase inhibitor, clade A (alpha-1 antiproteinase, antitrypsin), member 10a [Engraulis encrasicolus]|uniref:serpin peptidase inhibitor, clade A (alpha-1 antiproteinase, antitrypsin), member 10a n=1 Tax=Engraulis encrasicolus TaxID=184585 RepID=UPI002FD03FD8